MCPAGKHLTSVGCDEVLFDACGEGWGKAGERWKEEGVGVSVLVAETEGVQSWQDRGVGMEREKEGDQGDGAGPEEVGSGGG